MLSQRSGKGVRSLGAGVRNTWLVTWLPKPTLKSSCNHSPNTYLIMLPKLALIPELGLPASTTPEVGTTGRHDLIVSFLSGNTLTLLLIQCPAAWIQDPLSLKTGKLKIKK